MAPYLGLTAFFIALGAVVRFVYVLVRQSRRPADFPPGPAGVPVFGNLLQVPPTKSFLKFHELAKQYGPVVGLKLGPQNLVILNDYKAVSDLFDRKGGIYSSRPDNHIANDIIFQNETHILFLPYGESWRRIRRTLHDLLRINAVEGLLPIQNAESIQTMHDLLHTPSNWYDHVRRYSTAVILASVFGLRGSTFDSPRVKALYHVQDQNTAINELGATPPVDIFPFLKSLPDFLSPWRKWARDIRVKYRKLLFQLVRESKEHSTQVGSPDCFLAKLYREQEKHKLDDEHIAYLGGTLMEAGSDTTASTLLSFLLAMISYPEVLANCQREVDSICGNARSPVPEDTKHMPYIRACMKETLRWRPVAAGGIPHVLTQDDRYNGYFLPKGTIIFANAWSIHRTAEYENPDEFVPERWLQDDFGVKQENDSAVEDSGAEDTGKRRALYAFGAGRRICSGQTLAENSLMINMAKLVWAFNFSLPEKENLDTSVETGYFGGFLICPKKFPMQITPKSSHHAQVIEQEFRDVTLFLARFKD